MHADDAVAELGWAAETEAPGAFDSEHEPLVRQLVSTALRHRGWSILEAADGSIAFSVGPETLDMLLADYAIPAVLSPSAARKARSVRSIQRRYVHQPLTEELVSAGSSAE